MDGFKIETESNKPDRMLQNILKIDVYFTYHNKYILVMYTYINVMKLMFFHTSMLLTTEKHTQKKISEKINNIYNVGKV